MERRTTIATRLFLLVFGFSVAWFTLIAGVQLLFEYRSTRGEVDSGLSDLYQATRAGLENALWNYDTSLIRSSLDATREVRFLSGAQVRDEAGVVVSSWGQLPAVPPVSSLRDTNVEDLAAPLYHRFVLQHLDTRRDVKIVGELVLATDFPVLANRVEGRFRLLLSNYVASTLGLMVILLTGLRRNVSRPLGKVTHAIEGYRFDQAALVTVDLPRGTPDELTVLWRSFESLTANLKESYLQQRAMSAILEEAAVMALVCDADGWVLSSNAQARVRLVGGNPGESLGRLSYGEDSGPLFEGVEAKLASGNPWREDLTVHNDRGHLVSLSVAFLPLQVPDEPRARWGVMIEDMSARRLTEQYRRERDLAREGARAKSLFLANLSHEIRTPMNAVVGLTALVQAEEVSPQAREYLSDLEKSGAALLRVINDILDFAKLEEGKLVLETVDIDVPALLKSVGAMARFQAKAKGLFFSVRSAADVPTVCRGDPLRLQQVLMNLVANAVKFTEKGRVDVDVSVVGGRGGKQRLRFEVRDTGVGISMVDQGKLFHSFTQVDASTTRRFGGTGLGLAISHELVQLMRGTIGVDSLVGKGSAFWFEVPLVEGQASPDIPPPVGLRGLRVLLAEDNRVNQLVAREILKKVGIDPVVVSDGSQAVDRVNAQTFDLVLMDVQMPMMDGLEATILIRQTHDAATLPILAMTAHTFEEERQACLDAGMQDLVPKPVDPGKLYGLLIRWRPATTKT